MPTDLAQQMTQFQARYPFGSLTSELLTVHGDTYVVRAIAQVGSVVIATAIAASPDVEQAEDRAKARLLEALDTRPQSGLNQNPEPDANRALNRSPQPQSERSDSRDAAPLTSTPAAFKAVLETPKGEPAASEPGPSELESSPPDSSRRLPADSLPPMDETIPGLDQPLPGRQTPVAQSTPARPPSARPKSQTTDKPRLAQPPKPALNSGETLTPKDLSDIIAKTSVELRRLGWTEEQGREHLQSAYGKRSRQQLTDPELVDFLRHLEQQPTPSPEAL